MPGKKTLLGFAAALIALVAVAYFFTMRQDAGRSPDSGDPVKVMDLSDRSFDGAPALALTFSQPLDTRRNYDQNLRVFEMPAKPDEKKDQRRRRFDSDDEDDAEGSAGPRSGVGKAGDVSSEGGKLVTGSWVVGENPRLLYFPHIKPETNYVVQVAPGLRAANGTQLSAETRYSIRSARVSPAYYFASRGMVLPAKQNGGLPVVTVNVPEVDVQFLRVKQEQLASFLDKVVAVRRTARDGEEEDGDSDEYSSGSDRALRGAVGVYELDRLNKMTESVYLGRFTTEKTPNRRSVTFIPVEDIKELKEPGVYVAIMSQPGRFRYEFQTTYFYVSDLGLHVRAFPNGADAFVSSLTDGKAVSGVEVSWLNQQGRVLGMKETDGDGRAAFAERPKGAQVVMAKKGGQMSLIALREPALDLSEYDVTGPPYKPTRLYAYSGRNLYRPGETFDVSVIARDADGRPVPAQPVQAVLKRPDGKSQFSAVWQPDKRAPGYYLRRVEVPADAATGSWMLELRADPAEKVPGTVFRFGVEEFLPERMKLDLSSKQASLSPTSGFTVDVSGAYLYGAPAVGNRLLGVAQFERNRNPVAKKYPGFEFGDIADDTLKTRQEIAETALDDSGLAEVAIDLAPAAKRRSPVTVRATISLLESGGRPVVRNIERVVWPAPVLAGVRPLFTGDYARENSTVDFEVVRVDADGNLKPATALPVRLFREDRQYYWRFEDQRGWTSGFTETDELTETSSVSIPAAGRGKLALPVRYGRYRLEILDPETGQSLRYRFYAGWSARSDEAQGTRPDRVALKLDKPAYRDGETAQLTITPPHAGQALVTVEGDRTLWVKRIAVPETGTSVSIPVDKSWKRHDLYISVLVLRPGSEGDRVTPARALGITYLPLERGDRKLTVTLEASPKMRPENDLKVRVKVPEAKGEKALVTLSAVDVGILNITRYPSPDAHAFFFGKLRYGPDQLDVYGRLIEKMQGQKGRLRFGGDTTPKATRSLPKKVKLVDLFSGPVLLNEHGEAEISLPVPDFNGTLRLMAVVAAAERYGAKDAEVTVAAPVVAEIATPRFIAFGDSATVALDLHNLSGTAQKLSVVLGSDVGLRVADGRRSVTLKDQQKTTLRFAVEAGSAFGLSTLKLNVDGQDLKIERSFPLMVQAATPQQQIVKRYVIASGKNLDIRDTELGGFHRDSVFGHIVLSNQPPIDVRAAVHGLLTYPYGCAEQTTSTAYPHVFIDEDAAKRFGLKPYTREQRAEMLAAALGRLATMQAPAGGFSLWGNVTEYEYWLSAYVTNFLLDAREQGFGVPEAMQKKAGDFLLRGLQEGVSRLPAFSPQVAAEEARKDATRFWTDRRQQDGSRFGALAYGAYVLARESKAPLASLRQLHESRGFAHSGLALVQLGIALRLAGDEPRGNAAIAEGLAKPRVVDYWWGDYGTPLRDAALSYALLDRHQIKIEGKENLTALIASELEKKTYFSTQEKLALFLVGRAFTAGSGPWTAGVTVRGKTEDVSANGSQYREIAPADLANGLSVTNTHKDQIYVELSYSGFPVRAPAPKVDPIALARTLYTPDGAPIGNRALRTGETVMVHLLVRSRARIANGMVVDRIPAGLEIENLNIVQGEGMPQLKIANVDVNTAASDKRVKHREFRDDRFVAAVNLDGNPLNLFYRARVVTPGRYAVPPLYAEDMYRPDIYGIAGGNEMLTVVDVKAPARATEDEGAR
jgi:uncharacterized protein YfaS (alpha-2-macroglobulin family)